MIIPSIAEDYHYRQKGIGTRLMDWLIAHAAQQSVQRISLMVAKDNHAKNLYRQQGFQDYAETEDSILMVRRI